MQTTSALWKRIFREQGHLTEVKVVIDGVAYNIDKIFSISQNRTTYSANNPVIGSCTSSTLDVEIIPDSQIPRMSTIELFNRLVSADGTEQSGWLPAGTFYVDTRNKERDGYTLTLTAYDSMLKADQPYLENSTLSNWPCTDDDVADEIAALMGITVDSRTVLAGYEVPIPEQDWTMREVLGWIAAANGGNWIITPDNKLLLVKLEGITSLLGTDTSHALMMGDSLIVLSTGIKYEDTRSLLGDDNDSVIKFGNDFVVMNARGRDGSYPSSNNGQDIQKNARNLQNLGLLQPFTGVRLWRSHEITYVDELHEEVDPNDGAIRAELVQVEVEQNVFAGDETGRVLEADCPWATQAMADSILAQIEGYVWQGAVVEGAEITPAAELGDPVICDGVAFPLCSLSVTYDGAYAPTISAPADEEVDYEYHYESETERQLNRKVTLNENYYGFKVTRESGIEVANIVDGVSTTRMILNSNEQKFFDADGNLALYFDPVAGKYKFRGDVIVTPGYHVRSSALAIVPGDATDTQADALTVPEGFNLYGWVNDSLFDFLRIYHVGETVVFTSPTVGNANFVFAQTDLQNRVNLNGKAYYYGSGKTGNNAELATLGDIGVFIKKDYKYSATPNGSITLPLADKIDTTALAGMAYVIDYAVSPPTVDLYYLLMGGGQYTRASRITNNNAFSASFVYDPNAGLTVSIPSTRRYVQVDVYYVN